MGYLRGELHWVRQGGDRETKRASSVRKRHGNRKGERAIQGIMTVSGQSGPRQMFSILFIAYALTSRKAFSSLSDFKFRIPSPVLSK